MRHNPIAEVGGIIIMVNESEHWNRIRKYDEAQEIIKQFLLSRETDIAISMEDFGELEYAFEILIGRKPKSKL